MSHLNIVLRIIYILVNIIWLRTLLGVLRSSIPLQALFTEIIILNYLISRPFFHSWSHILFRKPYVNSIILSRHIDVKMFIYFCIFLQRAVEHTTTTPQSVSFTQELVAGELSQQMFLWVALIKITAWNGSIRSVLHIPLSFSALTESLRKFTRSTARSLTGRVSFPTAQALTCHCKTQH